MVSEGGPPPKTPVCALISSVEVLVFAINDRVPADCPTLRCVHSGGEDAGQDVIAVVIIAQAGGNFLYNCDCQNKIATITGIMTLGDK
jgi:hypothetical protein